MIGTYSFIIREVYSNHDTNVYEMIPRGIVNRYICYMVTTALYFYNLLENHVSQSCFIFS